MKIRAVIIMIVFSLCAVVPWAGAATVSPSSITIPSGMQSSRTITWTLNMTAPPASASSTWGEFMPELDSPEFARINTTLIAYFHGETATVRETLTIPIAVIKKAEELGLKQFVYYRNFPAIDDGDGWITIRLTSPSAAPLNINNMHLYFTNKRAEITVKRKEPGLKTFADINFTGKGLFKGYWQVDDRVISYVNKNLTYGNSLTIATPDVPSLPTFSEGTHVVKFIIQNPVMEIDFPRALYYVAPSESTEISTITSISPYNLAVLERKNPVFKWQSAKVLPVYLVEFMEEEKGEPVFAAYTNKTEYTVPDAALRNYLKSPQPYYWRVTGLDRDDNIAGESEVRQVRFKTE